ncbi:MAG: hypothetical protein EAZ73_10335 [Oscillatoriales cyanobacterium]|nr:MAG: hypothetical protein EAZ73_10335 [Oscillatoriales cyanobacterium]
MWHFSGGVGSDRCLVMGQPVPRSKTFPAPGCCGYSLIQYFYLRRRLRFTVGAGGFIEIVGTCYILFVNPPQQDIHCGTFCYKIVWLT